MMRSAEATPLHDEHGDRTLARRLRGCTNRIAAVQRREYELSTERIQRSSTTTHHHSSSGLHISVGRMRS